MESLRWETINNNNNIHEIFLRKYVRSFSLIINTKRSVGYFAKDMKES